MNRFLLHGHWWKFKWMWKSHGKNHGVSGTVILGFPHLCSFTGGKTTARPVGPLPCWSGSHWGLFAASGAGRQGTGVKFLVESSREIPISGVMPIKHLLFRSSLDGLYMYLYHWFLVNLEMFLKFTTWFLVLSPFPGSITESLQNLELWFAVSQLSEVAAWYASCLAVASIKKTT